MISPYFVFLGAVLNIIGGLSYFIQTIKGKVQPNKVTWFLWALAPLIAFAAQINQGVKLQALMTFMVGFNPLLVFIASFVNKKSYWKLQAFDLVCGAFSLVGLLFWYATRQGDVAIIFSIIADGLASIPTIIKAYRHPQTESYHIYLFALLSATITLLTIKTWSLPYFGFPAYIFILCSIMMVIWKFRAAKK